MAPPSCWCDEEYIALNEWFNGDDVQLILRSMPDPTRGRSRTKSEASTENLRSIADMFIARWQAQFNFPWKAETSAEYVERKAKLRLDHPNIVCKGWTFRHITQDETPEEFRSRFGNLPKTMYSFVQRSWVKARKTDGHAASAPTQPVFRIAPIHKRKKATARSVFIEDRKAQRSAAAKSEEGEEGEDGVEGVEEEGVENEENVAGEEGVQNEEGAKDDTVQTDAPTNLVKKSRHNLGAWQKNTTKDLHELPADEKQSLEDRAAEINAREHAAEAEVQMNEQLKRILAIQTLPETLAEHWHTLHSATGWVGATVIGGVEDTEDVGFRVHQVGESQEGLSLFQHIAGQLGVPFGRLQHIINEWLYSACHISPARKSSVEGTDTLLALREAIVPDDDNHQDRLRTSLVAAAAPSSPTLAPDVTATAVDAESAPIAPLNEATIPVDTVHEALAPAGDVIPTTPSSGSAAKPAPSPPSSSPTPALYVAAPSADAENAPVASPDIVHGVLPPSGDVIPAVACSNVTEQPPRAILLPASVNVPEPSTPRKSVAAYDPKTPRRSSVSPKKTPSQKTRETKLKRAAWKACQKDEERLLERQRVEEQASINEQWANGVRDFSGVAKPRTPPASPSKRRHTDRLADLPELSNPFAQEAASDLLPEELHLSAVGDGETQTPARCAGATDQPPSAEHAVEFVSPVNQSLLPHVPTGNKTPSTPEPTATKAVKRGSGRPTKATARNSKPTQRKQKATARSSKPTQRKQSSKRTAGSTSSPVLAGGSTEPPVFAAQSASTGVEPATGRASRQRRAPKVFSPDDFNTAGGARAAAQASKPTNGVKRTKTTSEPRKRARR